MNVFLRPPPIPVDLRFFADKSDKTEKPTPRKKQKAREEGQVAKSPEINTAFLFLAAFFTLRASAGWIFDGLLSLYNYEIGLIPDATDLFERVYLSRHIAFLFQNVIMITLPILLVVMVVGVITNIVQVGWKVTSKPMKPKFSKMNPMKGLKRLFSVDILVNLVKSLLKFTVVGMVIYSIINKEIEHIPSLLMMEIGEVVAYIGNLVVDMGLMVGSLFIFIAAVDYAYMRHKHIKGIKMSKQEIKEEYKNSDGNPQIKGKIKQKMREISMRRMMQDVPGADVIITNPNHFAAALRYNKMMDNAPKSVAKGVDFLAKRIKDVAAESGIPIIENPPLAKTLYTTVDVGHEIPEELYVAVADIIAYVFRLKQAV